MKMCSLVKNPWFCLTIILLIIKRWCLWCFFTLVFFSVWTFASNANCFSKMPQNVFWWVSNHQIWTFFLGTILHILHQVLIGSQKLEGCLNVIFIFYFYQNLAKSCYKWSLGATRNVYNSKLIVQFTLLSL